VVCATATGTSLEDARDAAYEIVDGIGLQGSQHRTDIAAAAIAGTVTVPS
jgi:phosphoribosylamine--glycine ligase